MARRELGLGHPGTSFFTLSTDFLSVFKCTLKYPITLHDCFEILNKLNINLHISIIPQKTDA